MEQLRRLPDETFKEFQEAGLFRAIQPKRYGGYELDPGVFFQVGMEIGTVCGSSACPSRSRKRSKGALELSLRPAAVMLTSAIRAQPRQKKARLPLKRSPI